MIFELLRIAYLFLPLLGGAVAQGLCIRYNWLSALAHPVDFHLTIRQRRLFGDNKTLRGFIIFSLGATLVFVLQANLLHGMPQFLRLEFFDYGEVNAWLLGFLLGFAAMLSELPNSFLKRQLDIKPGATARGVWLPIFYIIDQVDLLLGVWLVLSLYTEVSFNRLIFSVVFIFVVHQIINIFGYLLGMRRTIR